MIDHVSIEPDFLAQVTMTVIVTKMESSWLKEQTLSYLILSSREMQV